MSLVIELLINSFKEQTSRRTLMTVILKINYNQITAAMYRLWHVSAFKIFKKKKKKKKKNLKRTRFKKSIMFTVLKDEENIFLWLVKHLILVTF